LSTWTRLYINVEGQTEKEFVDKAIKPHLSSYEIDVRSRLVVTNRKLGGRGGIVSFNIFRADLARLMKEDGAKNAQFTTMIDLYALPKEFPGWERASKAKGGEEKVSFLEEALSVSFGDARFIPYIQLHEFEALLFCDLSELSHRISGSEAGIRLLQNDVRNLAPEDINEAATTAPSKRIIHRVPMYEKSKVRVGASAAIAIGLDRLRHRCPHFNEWISKLEALG
jgi:hypothetical protein